MNEKDIVEILQGYFYMTIFYRDVENETETYNTARIYSQREIETDEVSMNDDLRKELTQEFYDIAKEIMDKIKEEEKPKVKIYETFNGRTIIKD